VAKIIRDPERPIGLWVRLVQEAYVDAMLSGELIQFQLPAANPVDVPISESQGFSPFAVLGRAIIQSYKEDNGFWVSSFANCGGWEGRVHCEKIAGQLSAGLGGKVMKEINYPLET
jgi:hypothetical protein